MYLLISRIVWFTCEITDVRGNVIHYSWIWMPIRIKGIIWSCYHCYHCRLCLITGLVILILMPAVQSYMTCFFTYLTLWSVVIVWIWVLTLSSTFVKISIAKVSTWLMISSSISLEVASAVTLIGWRRALRNYKSRL